MVGRPRTFDRDAALETALRLFWERGYDGVGIAGLSAAIGVAPPSLYAAFGDKRTLFDEAAARYAERLDESLARDLAAPTAREAIERVLASSAAHFAGTDTPAGCLVMGEPLLAARRKKTRDAIRARLRQARAAGELGSDRDVAELAAFIDTVLSGMAAQARDGATHSYLTRSALRAMQAWPQQRTGSR